MKFTQDDQSQGYVIHAYENGRIAINGKDYHDSLILLPRQIIEHWRPDSFDTLTREDFSEIAELAPELLLLGTGATHRFPQPSLLQPLADLGIGVESMTTAAACRTYNILMSEGRRVAAALLI
ncbi:hypothetical protein DJ030_04960 [bacterium endosymbiont of Escarpia laminata]|nr:MAG: hypothetical protein DJ030_04960 [bacterium endosymbiont of Escarpia laminata]RLJ21564.1 MAG: hypothetical protein DJ031_02900 [bacterium endosymbiont of Escarpia laminata]